MSEIKGKKKNSQGKGILTLFATNYKCGFLLQSHFSLKKGAAALGIGTNSVILIKCDEGEHESATLVGYQFCSLYTYALKV